MINVPASASPKPIRSGEEHQAAKARVAHLMEMMGDGDESVVDELDVLIALIEAYENNRFDLERPSAVEAIRFRMEQRSLSQKDLEPFIGSRARVSEVLAGKRTLSPDMMRALHEGLSIPYESLMRKPVALLDPDIIEVKQPVLSKMKKIGFDVKKESVGDFLRGAFGEALSPALNRRTRTQRASGKTDPTALIMWQAAVLQEARRRCVEPFDPATLTDEFLREVAQHSILPSGPKKVIDFLAAYGIIVVIVEVLPGTFLDGGAMLLDGRTPVIGMTLRHDRTDNFWFTLLHELAHLQKDRDLLEAPGEAFFDELELAAEDDREQRADRIAAQQLIPPNLEGPLRNLYASTEDIGSVAKSARIHPAIAAGRWQRNHGNFKKFSRLIERNRLHPMLTESGL